MFMRCILFGQPNYSLYNFDRNREYRNYHYDEVEHHCNGMRDGSRSNQNDSENALKTLNMRFVTGDITEEEYRRMRKILAECS